MKLITMLMLNLCCNIQSVMLKSISLCLLSLNLTWTLTALWSEQKTFFTIDTTCLSFSNDLLIYTWSNNTTSQILIRLNVVFFEGLQPPNVLIMFLFSIKHSHLLTTKTTQDWYCMYMSRHCFVSKIYKK